MNAIPKDIYSRNVIAAGDQASGQFKVACKKANAAHSLASQYGILADDWETIVVNKQNLYPITNVKETIDGVGTKVQIYQNQFEYMFKERDAWHLSGDDLREECIDLWTRMLMDLIAMNADDLRNWELAISATDIIDINFLVWPNDDKRRGNLLQDTLSEAFADVIRMTWIAITAWETAILGESKKTSRLYKLIDKDSATIIKILTEFNEWRFLPLETAIATLKKQQEIVSDMKQEIDFNIWGTALGIATSDKLMPFTKDAYTIVALHERPKDGIIGPRSNGITKIRTSMEELLWEWWENKGFSDFIDAIGEEKESKISEDVMGVCRGKKMWEIATWSTTVFNPFVANTVLGGLNREPIIEVSKLIHVTGNPLKKISEGIANPWIWQMCQFHILFSYCR
jgi:hypothetical protein